MSGYLSCSLHPRHLALAVLLAAASASPARAQQFSNLRLGTPIRVRTVDTHEWRTGTLEVVTADSVWVRERDRRLVLAFTQLRTAEWRGGDAGAATLAHQGATRGALAGVAVTALATVACILNRELAREYPCLPIGAVFSMPLAVVGGAVGALVNASRGSAEVWFPIELP